MRIRVPLQLAAFVHQISKISRVFRPGFTLIELLVVIGVIGVLAAAIIAVVNPPEQIARASDAKRKANISQMGKSVEAYIVDNNGSLPANSTSWMTNLVTGGELKQPMAAISGNKACSGNQVSGYCYALNGTTNAYVYTYVQSTGEATKCSGGVGGSGASANVYYVYDTALGKACLKCGSDATAACNAVQ